MFHLCLVLNHRHNQDAVALDLLNQTSWPSLGYMIANGATTLWEAWDGDAHHIGKLGTSRNHIMYILLGLQHHFYFIFSPHSRLCVRVASLRRCGVFFDTR